MLLRVALAATASAKQRCRSFPAATTSTSPGTTSEHRVECSKSKVNLFVHILFYVLYVVLLSQSLPTLPFSKLDHSSSCMSSVAPVTGRCRAHNPSQIAPYLPVIWYVALCRQLTPFLGAGGDGLDFHVVTYHSEHGTRPCFLHFNQAFRIFLSCFFIFSLSMSNSNFSITHYRRTYHNFRLGKAEGAKGEINQFHVEPDMPAVDEALLEEETFFSLSGSMTKVPCNTEHFVNHMHSSYKHYTSTKYDISRGNAGSIQDLRRKRRNDGQRGLARCT